MPEFVKPDGSANVWYVDAVASKGFTADADQALKDTLGRPLIADGHLQRLAGRMLESMHQRVEQLWVHYLDQMEKFYDLQEDHNATAVDHLSLKTKMRATLDCLCIMERGWMFQQDPDNARKIVHRLAEMRYERESQ